MPTISGRDSGKPQRPQCRIAGALPDIRTEHLRNTRTESVTAALCYSVARKMLSLSERHDTAVGFYFWLSKRGGKSTEFMGSEYHKTVLPDGQCYKMRCVHEAKMKSLLVTN
jgi:hypothetical protein